jgi:eukaryotic translation initiation factor 2C
VVTSCKSNKGIVVDHWRRNQRLRPPDSDWLSWALRYTADDALQEASLFHPQVPFIETTMSNRGNTGQPRGRGNRGRGGNEGVRGAVRGRGAGVARGTGGSPVIRGGSPVISEGRGGLPPSQGAASRGASGGFVDRGRGRGIGEGRGGQSGGGGGFEPRGGGFRGGGGGGPRGNFRGRGGPTGPLVFAENTPARIDTRLSTTDQLITSFKKLEVRNKLPLRPGFGTLGNAITLRANFFPIRIPKGPIYDYTVEITPKTDINRLKGRIFFLLEQNPRCAEHLDYITHDNSQRLLSAKKLPQPLDIEVPFYEEGESKPRPKAKVYTVSIVFSRILDTSDLTKCVVLTFSLTRRIFKVL